MTRKDPRNQIIISTETNHIPLWTWQSDDTFQIRRNFVLVDESVTHLKETCPTSYQILQDWFLSTTNIALTQTLVGWRWAANPLAFLPTPPHAAIMLEWYAWMTHQWCFRTENMLGKIYALQHPIFNEEVSHIRSRRSPQSQIYIYFFQRTFPRFPHKSQTDI